MLSAVFAGLCAAMSAVMLALGIAAALLRRKYVADLYWAMSAGLLLAVSAVTGAPWYLFLTCGFLLIVAVFRWEAP